MVDIGDVVEIAQLVREVVLEENNGMSWCMCGIASGMILQLLEERGIAAEICCNPDHAFIEVAGWVVDVTADQFDNTIDPIVIERRFAIEKRSFWEKRHSFTTVEEFIAHQVETDWPSEQLAINLKDENANLRSTTRQKLTKRNYE